ncbi:MAG: c-type cytochrome [Candidatus Methylomirabilales bacterium]
MRKSGHALSAFGLLVLVASASVQPGSATGDPGAPRIVTLADIEFRPSRIRAKLGDAITFVNTDPFEHNVYIVRTANPNEVLFPATPVPSGKSITVRIRQDGLYTVYCTIHGGMTAKLSTTGSFELTEAEKREAAKAAAALPPIVKTGEKLFWGKGQCHHCHRMGDRGSARRGPNLRDIGLRAHIQAKKLGLASGTDYLVQSILAPQAYVVAGYTNDMATVYQPPIDLDEEQIKAVITYLQSQGGRVDTWAIDINKNVLDSLPSMNPFRNGNPKRGKEVFTEAGCNSCHAVGHRDESSIGPDLSAIGAYRNWAWLAESVIDPNAEIGANWKNATVNLKSGKSVSGILRKKTAKTIQIMVSSDQVMTLSRDKIGRIEISTLSRMPGDYGELLTFQQMADLLRYLQTLKGDVGGPRAGSPKPSGG